MKSQIERNRKQQLEERMKRLNLRLVKNAGRTDYSSRSQEAYEIVRDARMDLK